MSAAETRHAAAAILRDQDRRISIDAAVMRQQPDAALLAAEMKLTNDRLQALLDAAPATTPEA